MKDGFLNLLKPPGMTSSDAVVMVRRQLPRGVKVGHMGTLDPEAAGVLPLGVGAATRLFDDVVDKVKEYRAEIALGVATDTQDALGKVTARGAPADVEALRAALPHFIGRIEQTPPAYSAVHVAGKRMYELARQGESVQAAPRQVTVEDIRLVGPSGRDRYLLDIRCGRGVYVRTLCHDIGAALGCPAHMSFLLRTQAGIFSLADALTPQQWLARAEAGELALLPLDAPLGHIPRVEIDARWTQRARNGNSVPALDPPPEGTYCRAYLAGQFAGMGWITQGCLKFKAMLWRDEDRENLRG